MEKRLFLKQGAKVSQVNGEWNRNVIEFLAGVGRGIFHDPAILILDE